MNFKKRVNGSWVDTPNYIHKTDTDTFTTLPAVLYPTGTTATVGLKGNTVQSGTPTPDNPIMPQGTGERTGNLFDGELKQGSVAESSSAGTGYDVITDYQSTKRVVTSNPVVCHGATVTWNNSKYWIFICYFDKNLGYIGNTSQGFETWITTGVHEMRKYPYAAIAVRRTDNADFTPEDASDLNLVVDTYKIQISSASTTTPVYLGEVESTRRIKKLVLTGDNTENWQEATGNAPFLLYPDDMLETASGTTLNWLSNQYVAVTPSDSWSSYDYCITSTAYRQYLRFRDIRYRSLSDFKSYLAAQYAAGTPVCVWYILATPTTGIVNEPLRKIGDYADTVSGITIPTIAGADSFDVQTTLKPSEVSLTYTGWHNANVKELDGSEWQ